MSSYLSNLMTSTTSRYNSLRRNLLDNEADGDTEDDTHVSRVLRAYYTEKGRPFPPWLPPDPNDKRSSAPQSQYGTPSNSYYGSGRNQYGSTGSQSGSGRAGLGDLWDTPASRGNAAPAAPASLRSSRRPIPGAGASSSNSLAPPQQARPLPSQRAGSFQNTLAAQQQIGGGGTSSVPSTGSGTAQERLKARLWGGRGSPLPSPGTGQVQNPMDQYGDAGGGYRRDG